MSNFNSTEQLWYTDLIAQGHTEIQAMSLIELAKTGQAENPFINGYVAPKPKSEETK